MIKSNVRFVARFSILSFLLSLEDLLTHIASCVEKNRLQALWDGQTLLQRCEDASKKNRWHFFGTWSRSKKPLKSRVMKIMFTSWNSRFANCYLWCCAHWLPSWRNPGCGSHWKQIWTFSLNQSGTTKWYSMDLPASCKLNSTRFYSQQPDYTSQDLKQYVWSVC